MAHQSDPRQHVIKVIQEIEDSLSNVFREKDRIAVTSDFVNLLVKQKLNELKEAVQARNERALFQQWHLGSQGLNALMVSAHRRASVQILKSYKPISSTDPVPSAVLNSQQLMGWLNNCTCLPG